MLFLLEILRVMPALLFTGTVMDVYTPLGVIPMTLRVGEMIEIFSPDFHTTLSFQYRRQSVAYKLRDLLDSPSINFAPLPLVVRLNISREIDESDVRGLVIGHRGSGSDAYRRENNLSYLPENTIMSFEQAITAGADWVALDTIITSDGEIVINGNYKIGDTPIWNMTYAEFKRNVTYHSTFEQIMTDLDPSVKVIVQLKYPSAEDISTQSLGSGPDKDVFVRNLMQIVWKNRPLREIILASFEPDVLVRLRAAGDEFDVYFMTDGVPDKSSDRRRNSLGEAIQFCGDNDFQGIITDADVINRDPVELTAAAHDSGLQLLVYWLTTPSDGNSIVSQVERLDCADVDGFITDDIGLVKTVMSRMRSCVWNEDENAKAATSD